jgi:SAM-dependent methyltransferase
MDEEPPRPNESWSSGDAYEAYVGRWSRLVAGLFLPWLEVAPQCRWLDVGCGTGALAAAILREADPAALTGIDRSPAYIARVRTLIQDNRAKFEVGDAQALPVAGASYGAVVSGLMLNFIAEPHRAVAEMVRAAQPGGVVALYVWDYADKMEFLRYFWDAAVALDPAAQPLDEGRRFPICRPDALMAHWEDAGLHAVAVCALDVPTVFRDMDDFWLPFLGAQGPAPGYVLSLGEADRLALRARLEADLPIAADGSISLRARAWAVRGVR